MKRRFSKWLVLAALLPMELMAVEPHKSAPSSAIDLNLPIHQQKKLHPELSDPVLGDQAQIVEWAWSPQYAKRFNLPVQPDGLKDGGLWLVGVKIARKQYQQWQTYTCNIIGVMDNTLPILAPPGEQYMPYPSDNSWLFGLPGQQTAKGLLLGDQYFYPGLQIWRRKPANKREEKYPEYSDGLAKYVFFYRNYQPDLSYFQIEIGGCSSLGNPDLLRTEIRFPTRIDGKDDDDPKIGVVFGSSAVKFDLPDSLMRRIYPYALDADDWTSCLMRRIGGKTHPLSLRATKSKRFGNTCEPVTQPAK